MEILRQHHPQEHGPLHAIFVAIGGGGPDLGGGRLRQGGAPGDQDHRRADRPTPTPWPARWPRAGGWSWPQVGLFSDGTAVRLVGKETFRLCRRYVDEIVTVDTDALCAAIKDVFQETRSILEPAGALGVAGAKAYARADTAGRAHRRRHHLRREHELRSLALRRRARRDRREARGGLRGDHPRDSAAASAASARWWAIATSPSSTTASPTTRPAHVFVGVQLARPGDAAVLARSFEKAGFSDARSHRRRAGQAAPAPSGRRRVAAGRARAPLPLRVSRAARRADALSGQHVARAGTSRCSTTATRAPTTAGCWSACRCRRATRRRLRRFLATLGYRHWDESQNPAYKLFLA